MRILINLILVVFCLSVYDFGYHDFNNIHESLLKISTGGILPSSGIEGKTIRDICYNRKGFITIDTSYKVYYSSEGGNFSSHDLPSLSDPGKPKKVVCTKESFFVLTFSGKLFGFGNENNLFPGTVDIFEYQEIDFGGVSVLDVFAGSDIWYVILDSKVTGTNLNKLAKPGIGQVDYVSLNNVLDSPTSDEGYPKVQVISDGLLLTYTFVLGPEPNITHYFSGRFHPSLRVDVSELTKVDFREVTPDQIWNYFPIDFIVRPDLKSSCGVIASLNTLYTFGENCLRNMTFTSPNYVAVLSDTQNNDYDPSKELLIEIVCNENCYMTTKEETGSKPKVDFLIEVYGFGNDPTLFADGKIHKITTTEKKMMIIPKVGGSGYIYFDPQDFTHVHRDLIVNQNPPEISEFSIGDTDLGLNAGDLYFKVEKDTTFLQMIPSFYLGVNIDQCKFEVDGAQGTMWNFTHDYLNKKDVYIGILDWFTMNGDQGCNWKNSSTSDDLYYVFDNTIFFEEKFFVKYIRSLIFEATEEYELGVRILMSKEKTFEIDINVKRAPFEPYIAIFEKRIDEFNKIMNLKLKIETLAPIHLLYENHTFTNIGAFDDTGSGIVVTEDISGRSCDELHCYQTYDVVMNYDDCDVQTVISINNDILCADGYDEPDCTIRSIPGLYSFDVSVRAEDICLIVEQLINATVAYDVFKDWQRDEKYDSTTDKFYVGDYVYFTFDVDVEGQEMSLENVYFDYVKVFDKNGNNPKTLYKYHDNPQIKDDGDEAGFRIDTEVLGDGGKGANSMSWKVGFHFRFINDHLDLNFDEEGDIKVEIKLVFEFEGNVRRSIVSNDVKKYTNGHKAVFKIFGKAKEDGSIAAVVSVVSVLVVLSIVLAIVSAIFCGYFFMKKRNEKKMIEMVLNE